LNARVVVCCGIVRDDSMDEWKESSIVSTFDFDIPVSFGVGETEVFSGCFGVCFWSY
jgi:hypothetical protein